MAKQKIAQEVAAIRRTEQKTAESAKEPTVRIADGEQVIQFRIPFRISPQASANLRRLRQRYIDDAVPCRDIIGGGPEPIVLTSESCEEGANLIALNRLLEELA